MLIAISNQSDQSAMYKWIARETKAVNREGDKQMRYGKWPTTTFIPTKVLSPEVRMR